MLNQSTAHLFLPHLFTICYPPWLQAYYQYSPAAGYAVACIGGFCVLVFFSLWNLINWKRFYMLKDYYSGVCAARRKDAYANGIKAMPLIAIGNMFSDSR